MVMPWVGIPLGDCCKRFKPTSKAKYVGLHDAVDPSRCRASATPCSTGRTSKGCASTRRCIRSPAPRVGMYGKPAAEPERRAAAARRAVEVRLQEHQVDRAHPRDPTTSRAQPRTSSWNAVGNRSEYGFYANVNPAVDHPRWSQATRAPRCAAAAGPLAGAAARCLLATQLTRRISLNIPIGVGGDGHRHRVAAGHRHGPGGWHRHHPQEHDRSRSRPQEVRRVKKYESRRHQGPDHHHRPNATIREVLALTALHHISGVPVVDGEDLVGIVTSRDLRFEPTWTHRSAPS
jgi:hypothetical protein